MLNVLQLLTVRGAFIGLPEFGSPEKKKERQIGNLLKFVFSEKGTKFCEIFLNVLTLTYIVNVTTMRKIVHIFVTFSENLNFDS